MYTVTESYLLFTLFQTVHNYYALTFSVWWSATRYPILHDLPDIRLNQYGCEEASEWSSNMTDA